MKTFHLFFLFVVVGLSETTNVSSIHENSVVPTFFLTKWVNQCKLDSPEILYDSRIFPSLGLLLQEGKIFFSVVVQRLNSSLAGAEKYENLEKEWKFLLNIVNESFDLALGRIDDSWYDLIDSSDAARLPWEERLALAITLEQFHKILEEYKVLEAVFQAGTKEIVNTLQNYLVDVFEKLQDSMFYDPQDAKRASKGMNLVRRMEKSIDKLEPNFMGALMKKLVQTAVLFNTEDLIDPGPRVNFFAQPQEDLETVMKLFRRESQGHETFWSDMALVFKRVYGSIEPGSNQEILELYSNDDELVDLVISLLSVDLR